MSQAILTVAIIRMAVNAGAGHGSRCNPRTSTLCELGTFDSTLSPPGISPKLPGTCFFFLALVGQVGFAFVLHIRA